jgi:hypothetical protein
MPTTSLTTAQTHALQISIEQAGLSFPMALRTSFERTCQARLAQLHSVSPGPCQFPRAFHLAIEKVAETIKETRRQADQLAASESAFNAAL